MKKRFTTLCISALVGVQWAIGIPADPQPKKVRQPDGFYITMLMRGDERGHLLLADDGTLLFYNRANSCF